MRLDSGEARRRFAAASVLRLATADLAGRPHLVPCTFALDGDGRVVIGVDDKPKTTTNLRRLRNIADNPQVSLLVDHYADDWSRLWWARADGTAVVRQHPAAWALLRGRYPQYEDRPLDGPVILVTVSTWSGWAFQ